MQIRRSVHVALRKKERALITTMLNKGRESARVLRRALVLRQLDQGQTVTQVARQVGLARKTVRAIGSRYQREGIESALRDKPRPGQPRLLTSSQSQRIVALVCGPAPEGQARWSVRLILQEAVKRKIVPQVGRETIRLLLQRHDLKPWREKKLVRGGTE
jgi:putative transposase